MRAKVFVRFVIKRSDNESDMSGKYEYIEGRETERVRPSWSHAERKLYQTQTSESVNEKKLFDSSSCVRTLSKCAKMIVGHKSHAWATLLVSVYLSIMLSQTPGGVKGRFGTKRCETAGNHSRRAHVVKDRCSVAPSGCVLSRSLRSLSNTCFGIQNSLKHQNRRMYEIHCTYLNSNSTLLSRAGEVFGTSSKRRSYKTARQRK